MFPRLGSSGPGASWRHSAALARGGSRPRTPSLLMPASPSPLTGRVKCRAHVRAAIHATHAHVRMCVGMTGDYTYAVSSLQKSGVCAASPQRGARPSRVSGVCPRRACEKGIVPDVTRPLLTGKPLTAGRHGGARTRRRSLGSCPQGCGRREGDAHEPQRWDGWMTEVTTRPPRRDTSPHRGARHGGG